ncbi:MAG: hypothetical protein AB8G17_15245 [Gammaproteobacteria bacterium]
MNTLKFLNTMFLVPLLLASMAAGADDHELLLRVQDAVGTPGGRAVIMLRTYSTRPVGDGTICVRFDSAQTHVSPLSALTSAVVFGQSDDVVQSYNVVEQDGAMVVDLKFSSASASVNRVDGPFAAFYFQVAEGAQIGQEMEVAIDPGVTWLRDEFGAPIPIELRSGELTIRAPSAPLEVSAEVHLPDIVGQPVTLSLQTNEPFEIASGQIALRYSSRELTGEPVLRVDPRFGHVEVKLDGIPGLALAKILDAGADFNNLPGNIISVDIAPNPAFTFSDDFVPSVSLDPALTHLFDREGNWIPIDIENDVWVSSSMLPPREQNKKNQQR